MLPANAAYKLSANFFGVCLNLLIHCMVSDRNGWNFRCMIIKRILVLDILSIFCETGL